MKSKKAVYRVGLFLSSMVSFAQFADASAGGISAGLNAMKEQMGSGFSILMWILVGLGIIGCGGWTFIVGRQVMLGQKQWVDLIWPLGILLLLALVMLLGNTLFGIDLAI